jgi:hypothetical protein
MTMTSKLTALMMVALLAAATTAAAQSANRSGTPAPSAPARVERLAPEREAITACRRHCETAATPTRPSVAERQARQSYCAKRMAA